MKKLWGIVWMLLLCCFCGTASADEIIIDLTAGTASAGNVYIDDGCMTITEEGTYRISGQLPQGRIVVDASKDAWVVLILDGVEINCADYAPLYLKRAGCVEILLEADTHNVLTNGGSFAALDENNVDAVVFSKCDISIGGDGTLEIQSPAGHGLTGKDDVGIFGGELLVTAFGHTLEANDHLIISDGILQLTAGKDAIHTENDDDETLGIFQMEGGCVSIQAGDDAVHAVAELSINGGTMEIISCAEGLEAAKVYIRGGEIYINATDDAINATIGEDVEAENGEAFIHISGGSVNIVTKGDGLDSNGDILMEGGTVIVQGPGRTKFGFGALDYAHIAVINGGRFVALTTTGKAFSEESQQPSFSLNLEDRMKSGTWVRIQDEDGRVLCEMEAGMSFNNVIVSLPELELGKTCSVLLGDETVKVRQRKMVTKKKVQ